MASDETTLERPFILQGGRASAHQVEHLTAVLGCEPPFAPGVSLPLRGLAEVAIGRSRSACATVMPRSLGRAGLRLPDRRISRDHARLVREDDRWILHDAGSKNGSHVDGQRISSARLGIGALIQLGGTFFLVHRSNVSGANAKSPRYADERLDAFSTLDAGLRADFQLLERVARTDIPVIIEGATGTGKELTARAIHARSGRQGSFVPVNCGALPEQLIESELFGTRRGAFSGASEDRKGLAQEANGGTLFLDEIVELTAGAQAALLRLLQDGELRPVGATRTTRVDLRIVAATHADLERAVSSGAFREDLYARLAGHVIRLPALRDRRHDFGLFVGSIFERTLGDRADRVRITPEAALSLLRHPFPRNIRELDHILRRALALTPDHVICAEHLPTKLIQQHAAKDTALQVQLVRTLTETRGNVAATGRRMGKAPIQIRRWCDRFGIDVNSFRTA